MSSLRTRLFVFTANAKQRGLLGGVLSHQPQFFRLV